MSEAGLLPSFLGAIQASLSVLLVIAYGAASAHYKLLDSKVGSSISKICVKVFLPALLFTQIGSELHSGSAHRYLVVLLWALGCHAVSFGVGYVAHLAFGFPDWITAAIMFNNTTSYPLLLIQSLDATGILKFIVNDDEPTSAAIARAKSYFLVFATVSSCLTFAIGPRLVDAEHAPEAENDKTAIETDEPLADEDPESQSPHDASEQDTLLPRSARNGLDSIEQSMRDQRRAYGIHPQRWLKLHPRTRWILLFLYDFLNAPLLGAVVGAVVGLVPALHAAFFNDTEDGGIFTAWLTASIKSIGSLFVPLPVVVAGVSLYTSVYNPDFDADDDDENNISTTPWPETVFIMIIRFLVWPAVSISLIYFLAENTTLLGSDPMLWFTMMLMPTGPPAMKLIAMVQVSGGNPRDEATMAKILTISYAISPILAFTVVGSLRATQAAI